MPVKIPCVIMRGGTSKCVFFRREDLPEDPKLRDQVLLAIMGSPDTRQIDGLGGSFSTTSKICIIGKPSVPNADVDYTFGQVSITDRLVDYKGNCGNCSGAVGPFAIDEEMVSVTAPITVVRIYNTNTKKIIRAEVAVKDGRFDPDGDTFISGVPNPGSRVLLWFDDPGGAVTGKLLPTGNPVDVVDVPGLGKVPISIVDAANPLVFINGSHLGVDGSESPGALDADKTFSAHMEAIRSVAAQMCGLVTDWRDATAKSPAVPKSVFVTAPRDYKAVNGGAIEAGQMDVLGRIMSMQTCHRAYALTGAVATAAAAFIPGTVVHDLVPESVRTSGKFRLGHPSGTQECQVDASLKDGQLQIRSVASVRTARRIMEGFVWVPDFAFAQGH